MHDLALKQGLTDHLILARSQEEALRLLAAGLHDCALVAKLPALYWIEKHGWINLKLNETAITSPEYCYAVAQDNSDLLARLSEGLATLKLTGEYRKIYSRWLGVYEKPDVELKVVLKYSAIIVLPILFLLVGSIMWTKSLKLKVANATDQLRQLFDEASYGILLTDPHAGTLVDCNHYFCTMLGRTKAEVIGKSQREIASLQTLLDVLVSDLNQDPETQPNQTLITQLVKDSGEIIVVDIKSSLIDLGGKKLLQSFFKDVTKQNASEAALKKAHTEMTRFVYTVSHDLKSPLVTIKGFLGILRRDLNSGDQQAIDRDMAFIVKAADRMFALLDDLLELSRIGRLQLTRQECSFRGVVDSAKIMVLGTIGSKNIEISVVDTDVQLLGDYNRLLDIWQNLLENAVKYSAGQDLVRIAVGFDQQAGERVFFVRDNGIGIEPEFHEKIFGLFEKLDPQSAGTGLGLALVAKIVSLYQGRIWVESAGRGQGSRFCFTLPAASVAASRKMSS